MNREIKFRVWDKENKLMFPHTLIDQYDKDGFMLWGDIFSGQDKTVELMQFTGLTDNNGKEIYEGDICKMIEWWFDGDYTEYGFVGTVKYEDGEFGLHGNGKHQYEPIDEINIRNKEIEVIGNIYENSELLVKETTE